MASFDARWCRLQSPERGRWPGITGQQEVAVPQAVIRKVGFINVPKTGLPAVHFQGGWANAIGEGHSRAYAGEIEGPTKAVKVDGSDDRSSVCRTVKGAFELFGKHGTY